MEEAGRIHQYSTEKALRRFARQQAFSVSYLWLPPDVVTLYLFHGDGRLREAAKYRSIAAQYETEFPPSQKAAASAAWAASDRDALTAAREAALAATIAINKASVIGINRKPATSPRVAFERILNPYLKGKL